MALGSDNMFYYGSQNGERCAKFGRDSAEKVHALAEFLAKADQENISAVGMVSTSGPRSSPVVKADIFLVDCGTQSV